MTRPAFRADPLPGPGPFTLDGDEGHHAATVQRLRAGETLTLVDGHGTSAPATVTATVRTAGRGGLTLDVGPATHTPPTSPRLVVVQALAKGDRGELAVELLTEAGVDIIVPWSAARSITRWDGDRGSKALARWQATAAAAAKQSRRTWWPQITDPATTVTVAARLAGAALAVVLDADAPNSLTTTDLPPAGDIVIVIGPEGGIGADELTVLDPHGRYARRLGPHVLRTSTAGAVAVAAVSARLPRWA